MAKYPRPHRLLFRRTAVLIALIMAGGGLVALEHTATGASTGTPSHSYGQSSGDHGGNGDPGDGHHHGSTTSSSSTSSTSTTSTTMPPKHCRDQDNNDRNHHDHKHHCRPPSGGQKPKPPHDHHDDPHDKHGNKNGHR